MAKLPACDQPEVTCRELSSSIADPMMSFCLVKITQWLPARTRLATVPTSHPWPEGRTPGLRRHLVASRIAVKGTNATSIVLQSTKHPLAPVFLVPVSHQPPAAKSATAAPHWL